jgi:DNA-binding transcriptional MerR regulator
MDNELISKKELLELTGISYGQLYRWKRKKLIPEDWFVKKSSFTGQETFFPKEKILDRIKKIKNMKDDLSLDDIAEMFSPELSDILLEKEELVKSRNIPIEDIGVFFITPCAAKVTSIKAPYEREKSCVDGAISIKDIYLKLFAALGDIKKEEELKNGELILSFVTEVSKFMQAGYLIRKA